MIYDMKIRLLAFLIGISMIANAQLAHPYRVFRKMGNTLLNQFHFLTKFGQKTGKHLFIKQ